MIQIGRVVGIDPRRKRRRRMGHQPQQNVDYEREGFKAEKITGKLGVRASDTAELLLNDVHVPEENLIGKRDKGFWQQMDFFDQTRTMVATQATGIARGALEPALEYSKEREQFNRPISKFQGIKFKLAKMNTGTEAAVN